MGFVGAEMKTGANTQGVAPAILRLSLHSVEGQSTVSVTFGVIASALKASVGYISDTVNVTALSLGLKLQLWLTKQLKEQQG